MYTIAAAERGVFMESPKYLVVQEWIKSEINKGIYVNGDKLPSENELMDRFGFSRQTIRLAISNLENMGYLERVKGSGTYVHVHNSSAGREEKNIGVILRHLDYYIYPEIVKGIESYLMQNGYTMTLGITHDRTDMEASVLNSMMEKKLDGIISEPCKTAMPMPVRDVYARISTQLPLVFLGGGYQGLNIPVVSMDYTDGARLAAEHLIKMGHRSIGCVLRSDDLSGHFKYEGVNQALAGRGIKINDRNVLWFSSDMSENLLLTLFKQVYFSGLNRCTALVCHNDKIAEIVVNMLKGMNVKVFEDVSIVSFDNSATAEMLGLTSVEHCKSELGAKAAEVLLRLIRTKGTDNEYMKGRLVLRDSVKKRGFSSSWGSREDLTEIFEE